MASDETGRLTLFTTILEQGLGQNKIQPLIMLNATCSATLMPSTAAESIPPA